jgi:hypothetical protein
MPLVDKILFFTNVLDENATLVTSEQIHDYIMSYIQRNDNEIQQLTNEIRPGRPRPNRLELLEMLKAKDMKDFQDGIGKFLKDSFFRASRFYRCQKCVCFESMGW